MLFGRIVANQQNRRRVVHVAHGRRALGLADNRGSESREVGRAVVVNVVGLEHHAGELLQEIALLVRGAVGAENSDRRSALAVANGGELFADQLERFFPGRRRQSPVLANERLG